jgi:hypothetical protein
MRFVNLAGTDDQRGENIVAASDTYLSENIPFERVSTLLRCEKITVAVQVRWHRVVVMPGKDFWVICSTCNCMNRGTGEL